jgi:hypothetical protein
MNLKAKIGAAAVGVLGISGILGASWAAAQGVEDPPTSTTTPGASAPADSTPAAPAIDGRGRGPGGGRHGGEDCDKTGTTGSSGTATTPSAPATPTPSPTTTPTTTPAADL